ncbi:histone-lysine N-methyltransferase, H3 lysine-9 specific SUVH5-like [Andrographis paniculata]|uniref:histone-lysine N-methyltransferase, H3 lysine-9 specific SUVH5-like n=1 Tax=Andrographis paniculata TaxID=175694 RepID=UPI0021E8048B|nr:histone-lysine N-methyltransferase, H3 lysine-9 specific SUVH5-like [Andrographis paniculata]
MAGSNVLMESRKHRSGSGSCSTPRSPPKFKRRKVEAVRDFPANCGTRKELEGLHKSFVTNTATKATGGEDGNNTLNVAAISAVPLKSVPVISVQSHSETINPARNDGEGLNLANGNEIGAQNTFGEDQLQILERLDARIADAKEFISLFDMKYRKSEELERSPSNSSWKLEKGHSSNETKLAVVKTLNRVEARGDINVAAECNTTPSLESSLLRKMVEVEARFPRGKQVEKALTLGYIPENEVEKVKARSSAMLEPKGVELSKGESSGTEHDKQHPENGLISSAQSFSLGDDSQDKSLAKFTRGVKNTKSYSNIHVSKSTMKQEELINLTPVKHDDPQGYAVKNVLKLFEETYNQLLEKKSEERKEGKKCKHTHKDAAKYLKDQGMCFSPNKPFGHIPGVEVGDVFIFRAELAVIGLHCHLMEGIDYIALDGKIYATSIVNSGRYTNEVKSRDVLVYSGQGGNPHFSHNLVDQKPERGNLALINSMEVGYPIRVTTKRDKWKELKALGMKKTDNTIYIYDGVYTIHRWWQERDGYGKNVFKFELHRILNQPRTHQGKAKSMKQVMPNEVCVINDISYGKEKFPICARNGVDNDRPRSYTYITNIMYSSWYKCIQPIGCDCVGGCSDSHPCTCVSKNGGEIPFNKNGMIVKARPIVHECGPSCKCPPTCMNRVTQHGPKYQFEVFKTKTRGWGVRSKSFISSGRFICEYIGELLRDKEAEQRIGNDEYLFDIGVGCGDDGFTIDGAKFGNVGRFINHSCSPNLYAQDVLYDHGDKRMPHIMFFASKNILPLTELCYDYNYKIGSVCDHNGKIKAKDCHCGSRQCTGRMY